MISKPTLFICSSSESLPIAKHIQAELERDVESTIWTQNVFDASDTVIESLEKACTKFDFAIVIASGDDRLVSRHKETLAPRDNVIFELGLFAGAIGRHRVFLLVNRDNPPKLPSDLAGFVYLDYGNRADGNIQAAISPSCQNILQSIRRVGISASNHRVTTDKESINNIWRSMIFSAHSHIGFIAGDASWSDRDHQLLRQKSDSNVKISIICHYPNKNVIAQNNVRLLLESNCEVKYFDPADYRFIQYGLIVDGTDQNLAAALMISKERKPIHGSRDPQDSAYAYRAIQYYSTEDFGYIQLLSTVFSAVSASSPNAAVLSPISDVTTESSWLLDSLRSVNYYENIEPTDISLGIINLNDVFSSCNYVKTPKLEGVSSIVNAYQSQGISDFCPVYCTTNYRRTLLLPPILEDHGGKLVVVDGTHRLFYLYAIQQRLNAYCLILKNRPELPGKPVPFKEVKAWPRNLSRRDSFKDYKPSLFRNFIPMDNKHNIAF